MSSGDRVSLIVWICVTYFITRWRRARSLSLFIREAYRKHWVWTHTSSGFFLSLMGMLYDNKLPSSVASSGSEQKRQIPRFCLSKFAVDTFAFLLALVSFVWFCWAGVTRFLLFTIALLSFMSSLSEMQLRFVTTRRLLHANNFLVRYRAKIRLPHARRTTDTVLVPVGSQEITYQGMAIKEGRLFRENQMRWKEGMLWSTSTLLTAI